MTEVKKPAPAMVLHNEFERRDDLDSESKYGYAQQLATLSDDQLVARFNAEVGNRGWGAARTCFLACLRIELLQRDFDATAIVSDGGLKLERKVELRGGSAVG